MENRKKWISYILMPVVTFIDQLHVESGVALNIYDEHRFYLSSIHVVVWLRISVLLSIITFIGFIHPTIKIFHQLLADFAAEQHKEISVMYLLTHTPSESHLKWFIFIEIFCILHILFTCIGIRKGIPLFFAPSQIILIIASMKLFCTMMMNLLFCLKDTFDMVDFIIRTPYLLDTFNTVKEDHGHNIIAIEAHPVASGFVDLMILFGVITFIYIIERSMQNYKYEECVADFQNYIKKMTEQERQRDLELYWVENQQNEENQTWAPCYDPTVHTAILYIPSENENNNATCNF